MGYPYPYFAYVLFWGPIIIKVSKPLYDGLLVPNSIMVVYMEPLRN